MTDETTRLLDLCCCEGGAARGYYRAGWTVYGVDTEKKYRKRYPYAFHCGSALDVLVTLLAGGKVDFHHKDGTVEWLSLSDFAAVHASPPCQHASAGTRAQDRSDYPRLIEPLRALLIQTGLAYVIENVEGADLHDPLMLCATEFGLCAVDEDGEPLELERHRNFESNIPLEGRGGCKHGWFSKQVAGVYGGARRVKKQPGDTLATLAPRDRHSARHERGGGYVPRSKRVQERLLGIDWMTQYGRFQSLPPVYCEHVGAQLLRAVSQETATSEAVPNVA